MNPNYHCVCCALPHKLVQHLAAQAEPASRAALQAHADHSQALRGQRGQAQRATHSVALGAAPTRLQVFNAEEQENNLPGVLLGSDLHSPKHDLSATHALQNLGIALEFFKQILGYNAVDGQGGCVDVSVHYRYQYSNAMWTGQQLVVGDGDGVQVRGLAGSLGLIAHELAHGVSQHVIPGGLGLVPTPGGFPELKGQAGALNESFSDVCASMVKQWHAGQDAQAADWLLGEDIFVSPKVGHAVRSLKDPGNCKLTWLEDDQIKDFTRYKTTQEAHTASGIANHAFYVAATALGGHAWETLGPVWFKGFAKLRSRATFLDAAHATVDVAATLHGSGSAVHKSIKKGWKAVKVMG